MAGSYDFLAPLLGQGLRFHADAFSLFFVFLTLWVWPWATLFSAPYLKHAHAKPRFYLFWFLTLSGCMGSFLAADLFTLYLFFELMTFASWALVLHEEDFASLKAGNTYLYLSLAGGLAILGAAFLLQGNTGATSWIPTPGQPIPSQPVLRTVAILLFTGFGIKTGLFPLHFWLPQAHPVAPAPASAILSGILLKVGAYGLLRTMNLLLSWQFALLPQVGMVLTGLAVVTMLWGAVRALGQTNIKPLLAFSSVSQLGFVALGTGLIAFLGSDYPLAWAAALYHILNHALAKSALFLAAGGTILLTRSPLLSGATGLGRFLPGLAVPTLLAAAAVAGVPGLSGYISKTLLHHVVVHAAGRGGILRLLDPLFILAGAGTVAYYIKFWLPWQQRGAGGAVASGRCRAPSLLWLPVLALAASSLLAGSAPSLVLNTVLLPAVLAVRGQEEASHLAAELAHLNPGAWPDLCGALITLSLGTLLYLGYSRLPRLRLAAGRRSLLPLPNLIPWVRLLASTLGHALEVPLRWPKLWARKVLFTLAFLARVDCMNPLAPILRRLLAWGEQLKAGEELVDLKPFSQATNTASGPSFSGDLVLTLAGRLLLNLCRFASMVDVCFNRFAVALGGLGLAFFRYSGRVDDSLEGLSRALARGVYSAFRKLGSLEKAPPASTTEEAAVSGGGWERYLHLDLLNLDMAVLVLALFLILTLMYFLLRA